MGSTLSFLFDECLTTDLPEAIATTRHYGFHVRDLGMLGLGDPEVVNRAIAADYVVVTNNRADYLRLYRRLDLHSGLVVIVPAVPRERQVELFLLVVAHIDGLHDLINKLVEIDGNGLIVMTDLPPL
jgi:predicted nuclease of predicted toxin-antitoxin system